MFVLKLIHFLLFIVGLSSILKGQETISEISNIPYTDRGDTKQTLNLLLPHHPEDVPLLIWIGGGAWSYGNKDMEMDLGSRITQQGIAFASVGHRLSPATWRDTTLKYGIRHPEHIKDIAAAVSWLYIHAEDYGYSPNNFFIGGYSSGAHLAALLCLDSRYLAAHSLEPNLFKGLIPISGTYDIPHYRNILMNGDRPELAELHVDAVFGDDSIQWIEASPTRYLQNLNIPLILISDHNLFSYTKLFEEKILRTTFRNIEVLYTYKYNHGELWRNLSHAEHSRNRNLVIDFLNANSLITE